MEFANEGEENEECARTISGLCFVGGLVGVGIAQLLILVIPRIYPVLDETYIPAWAIILSFGFAGSVGIFFGMFPAIKAARLDPIEALRHE